MIKNSLLRKIAPLLPLLAIYITVIFVFSNDEFTGDESRYINYATNLTNGYFSSVDNPDLRNGPGYPLVLAPFLMLGVELIVIKLLNAFFVFIGVVYFKKTIELFTKKKIAIIIAFLVGLYPPLIRHMPYILSESLAFMAICGLTFAVCKSYQTSKMDRKLMVAGSVYLGLLVLVKVIFLQVIAVSLLLIAGVFLFYRKKSIKFASTVLLGGFALITPYLIYAYLLTGKPFYLGTQGGEILYHRSTPYENELGNWFSRKDILDDNVSKESREVYQNLSTLSENHRDFYLKTEPLTPIERDSAMKAKAIQNIKVHPVKYFKNTVANIGRLFFHYPFSYREQTLNAYGYMVPNMFILVLWVISLYPAFLSRKKVPFEIRAVMIFTLIYASGMILLGGRGRHFIIMVPAIILFSTYIYTNCLHITLVKK